MFHKYLLGCLFFLLFSLIVFNLGPQRHRVHGEDDKPEQASRESTANDSKSTFSSAISPNVGQWLLYKVNLKDDSASETVSFTMKISLVGKEIIDKQTYFWEELNIPNLGVIIKRLSNSATGKVKKCVFQRKGDQPIEFELGELCRQMDEPEDRLVQLLAAPTWSFTPKVTEPAYRITSRKETSYSFPQSHKKLQCERTNYEDLTQTLKLCIWTSIDIPITNVVKSEVTTKKLSTFIILLDFGLTGASSRITGNPVRFGVTK